MFHYVYILLSLFDKKLYVGYTKDLKKRIMEHNRGQNFSTKSRRPLEPIFFEAFRNESDARAREKFFKTGWGRQYIKKVLKNFLNAKT
jgi:putative endonuclease